MSIERVIAGIYNAYAYESITVADTAIGLTDGTMVWADEQGRAQYPKQVLITIEDGQIRWRYDGTDPTSAEGHISNPNDVIIIKGTTKIKDFRAIRKTTTSAKLRVTYER